MIAGLLDALTADLDAIHAHRSKQQESTIPADPNSSSLLPVFDDRPANGGRASANGHHANGTTGQGNLTQSSANGTAAPASDIPARQSSLQDDIDGLLEGLDVGDILDLGLPDAPESTWAAPDLASPLLQDPFAELGSMDPQQENAPSQLGSAQRSADGQASKQHHGTPQKSSAAEEDEPLSDSDVDIVGNGKKVSPQAPCKQTD